LNNTSVPAAKPDPFKVSGIVPEFPVLRITECGVTDSILGVGLDKDTRAKNASAG